MIGALLRALCRWRHGGLAFDGLRCSACGIVFEDAHEAGRLREFTGRVRLDPSRVLDEERQRFELWAIAGWRVVRGGQLVADAHDYSGRRVMGGHVVKLWAAAPEPKRAMPIAVLRRAAGER